MEHCAKCNVTWKAYAVATKEHACLLKQQAVAAQKEPSRFWDLEPDVEIAERNKSMARIAMKVHLAEAHHEHVVGSAIRWEDDAKLSGSLQPH